MPPRQRASDAFAKVGAVTPPEPAPAGEADGRPLAPEAPEMDDALLGRWRWQLSATARKAVAAQERAAVALAAWERLCADAANAGVPERLVVAAAADAGVDVPGGE